MNENLTKAKSAKRDEFYTQLSDIEQELKHYKEHFNGKVVYCNCDDPQTSNFFRYFSLNFKQLGLKRLITTCYAGRNGSSGFGYCLLYDGQQSGNEPDFSQLGVQFLEGDGDFRSPECVELLKQSDIVVTNPPFSLFREFIDQLVRYKKQFLVIGNKNAVTYKDIFKLIKGNLLWLGYTSPNEFYTPDEVLTKQVQGLTRWFTNLEARKRHENLILIRTYEGHEQDYPTYANYDAIEVGRTKDIPMDYDGVIGVPISFLDKYNPDQFEIIGMAEDNGKGFSGGIWDGKNPHCVVRGQNRFKRLFIQRKENHNGNPAKRDTNL